MCPLGTREKHIQSMAADHVCAQTEVQCQLLVIPLSASLRSRVAYPVNRKACGHICHDKQLGVVSLANADHMQGRSDMRQVRGGPPHLLQCDRQTSLFGSLHSLLRYLEVREVPEGFKKVWDNIHVRRVLRFHKAVVLQQLVIALEPVCDEDLFPLRMQ